MHQCHNDSVTCLTTVHSWGNRPIDDPHVLSGSEDGEIKAWDMRTGTCTATLHGHTDTVTQMIVLHHGRSENRKLLLISASADHTIKQWELADDSEPEVPGMPNQALHCLRQSWEGHDAAVTGICLYYTHNTPRVVSCARDSTIKVWLLATGDCIRTFVSPDHDPRCVKVINDGQHKSSFITGGGDCRLKVWRITSTTCVASMCGHTAPVSALDSVPLEPLELLSAGEDGSVRLWNLDRMCQLRVIEQSHTGPITGLVCWLDTTAARLLELELQEREGGGDEGSAEHRHEHGTHYNHASGMKLRGGSAHDGGGGLQSYLFHERAR